MTLAVIILSVLATLALLGALSGGTALGLNLLRPGWSRRRRIFTAAVFATLLPMTLPFGGFLLESGIDDPNEWALGLTALIVLTAMIAAVVGLPAAWWATLRVERAEGRTPLLADDGPEQALIAGEA